jgi:hypothetical protein
LKISSIYFESPVFFKAMIVPGSASFSAGSVYEFGDFALIVSQSSDGPADLLLHPVLVVVLAIVGFASLVERWFEGAGSFSCESSVRVIAIELSLSIG